MPNIDISEIGSTGLERIGGFVREESLDALIGKRGTKIYKEMADNDPIIGGILFAIEMLIRQVTWNVEPVSTDKEDIDASEFLESVMDDMSVSWSETISEIISFLPYGWSWHEIVYKRRLGNTQDPTKRSKYTDGKIGWRKLPIRSQDTLFEWEFDDDGSVIAMRQQASPDYSIKTIPIEKSLLFRTRSRKGNPEGRSILRNCYRPWYFKRHIENIEGVGAERDLAGLPVALVPPHLLSPSANNDEKTILNEIKKIVTNIRRDEQEGLIFPLAYDENGKLLYDFKLLSTGGNRQFDTDKIINRYDQRIAMTVLADFILMGHEKVGSFALSSSKTNMFSVALGAWLDHIASVFNNYAVPRLFKLNGYALDYYPQIIHGDVESIDLTELGDYITKLVGAGMPLFPDEKLEAFLKKQANLPTSSEG